MEQDRQAASLSAIRINGREISDPGEMAAELLRIAVDHAVAANTPLGHEALAAVILPQVPEKDRAHLEIGLYAAFRHGLFKGVSADVFENLPQDKLSLAVDAGRDLFIAMEEVQASRNPMGCDF